MADLDISNRNASNQKLSPKNFAISSNQHTNLKDIASMKAWLTANKPASYPTATLAKMTKNDLLYACLVEGLA